MEATDHVYQLDAYGERIGYAGPWEPTLAVLRQIQFRHTCSIPFENLDILLGQPISLNPADLERKLIHDRRGGYCFEQNGLMLGILRQIGFAVTPRAGRVRLEFSERSHIPPRTHLFLTVEIDGQPWIFDAGVGGASLTAPIRYEVGSQTETPHDVRTISQDGGRNFHQLRTGDTWKDVYEFTGEEMPEIDREVSNWWTSTSPNAKFSKNLMAAIARPDGTRAGILNRQFLVRRGNDVIETRPIDSADHLLELLGTEFGLQFPAGTRFGIGDQPWPTE